MVTQDMLERLRAERRTPQPAPAPSMDPSVQRSADAYADHFREQHITLGEQKMRLALCKLRADRAQAVLDGYAQSRFNRQTQEVKP